MKGKGTLICIVIIILLIVALGITYYFGFVKNNNDNEKNSSNNANTVSNDTNMQEEMKENNVSNTAIEKNTTSSSSTSSSQKNYVGAYEFKEIVQNHNEEIGLRDIFGSSVKYGLGYLILNDDNTFTDEIPPLYNDQSDRKGKYSVNGNKITLNYDNGNKSELIYNSSENTIKYNVFEDYYLILKSKDMKLANAEKDIEKAFSQYIQKIQNNKEMDELLDISNIGINILSDEQTKELISKDSASYKQGDIMATINYTVRPQDINNTKWLAGNGTINGDFIDKSTNVVLRNGELIIIGTSW